VLLISMREALEVEMDQRLRVRASQVQLTIWPSANSLTTENLTEANLNLAPLAALNAPNLYVQVVARDGHVLATSDNLRGDILSVEPSAFAGALGGATTLSDIPRDDDVIIRTLNTPITADDGIVGVLEVGQSRRSLQETMARLQRLVQTIGLGSLVVAVFVGWAGTRQSMRMLGLMARRAARITSQRDFSQRLDLGDRKDEVGKLSGTIDELLSTIDETLRIHREFVADTSHELRNPLLAIRTNLDLLDRVEDPEAVAECVSEARQQVDRMSRLVADLVLLARLDAGELVERRPLELCQLVAQAKHEGERRASGQRIEVTSEPIEFVGDDIRLTQVLTNLVDNALKHTPPGGTVGLDLKRDGEWARITVADDGEGIPEEDLPRVFDRFFRARSRSWSEGTGLGLAIVKHLTEAHGGRVTVESEIGSGARFMVWLPLTSPSGFTT